MTTSLQLYLLLNEQQAGPYTEEQVRDLVKAGSVAQTDYCWHEGIADWQQLNSVLTFQQPLPSVVPPPAPSQPTKKCPFCAEQISIEAKKCKHCGENIDAAFREADEAKRSDKLTRLSVVGGVAITPAHEEEIWSGSPSQFLNVKLYLIWGFLLICTVIAGLIQTQYYIALVILIPIALIQCIWAYLTVKKTRYAITTQRVRVSWGIFNKDVQEIELFRVKDTAAHQPFLMRLFKLGTIQILSGDSKNPDINLIYVSGSVEISNST